VKKLELTVGMPGGDQHVETYDPQKLVHPADVGRRSRGPKMSVKTQEEAEEWGRALVDAFNRDAKKPRTFIAARLVELDADEVKREGAADLMERAERSYRRACVLEEQASAARRNYHRLKAKAEALMAELAGEE